MTRRRLNESSLCCVKVRLRGYKKCGNCRWSFERLSANLQQLRTALEDVVVKQQYIKPYQGLRNCAEQTLAFIDMLSGVLSLRNAAVGALTFGALVFALGISGVSPSYNKWLFGVLNIPFGIACLGSYVSLQSMLGSTMEPLV